jgi:iron transport multicopper oxidase
VKYFESNQVLAQTKKIETAINGAYHAEHLWIPNLEDILGDDLVFESASLKPGSKMMSINSGGLITATTVQSLLLECMREVMGKRFRWSHTLRGLCDHVKQDSTKAEIHTIGPDRVSPTVCKALVGAGVQCNIARPIENTTHKLPSNDDIAIVGMSCRLPDADDPAELWDLLSKSHDAHRRIPPERFDLGDHFDEKLSRPNTIDVAYGCFLRNPGLFDSQMFKMSPREAKQTDPMQRIALMTVYEALEQAGYSPEAAHTFASERVASFWGQTVDDYRETNACQEVDIYYVSGGVRAFTPGRMNYHFKWEGPSMSVDTACSSSALAIHLAFQALRAGECDTAIAGGANIITGPDMYAGLARGGFLSKSGQCKTFDDTADGYCRGEGVGAVVLKRLTDAIADHDNILAVIKSCATNHATHSESITRPDSVAQAKLMRRVLREADVAASDVDYVEMHGTGTQAGDAAEFTSVSSVFVKPQTKVVPIHIGSIKANVGHGEAVAGISSLIKAVLILQHDMIPAHIGISEKVNSRFDKTDLQHLRINRENISLPPNVHRKRRIMVNSFNAAGGNTALLVEEAPKVLRKGIPCSNPTSHTVVATSGHTLQSLQDNQNNLQQFLRDKDQDLDLRSLAYTSTARRLHHGYRRSYVVKTAEDLVAQLAANAHAPTPTRSIAARNVVFCFPGQGRQSPKETALLLKQNRSFRRKLQQYEVICWGSGLPGFLRSLDGSSGEPVDLVESHLAIVAVQMALVSLLKSWGIVPTAVIGHSIGEYAGLVISGVLDEASAIYLVGQRAKSIQRHCKASEWNMVSVMTSAEDLRDLLAQHSLGDCAIACKNASNQQVLSGPREDILRLCTILQRQKIIYKPLDVDFGFHSPQMEQVARDLRHHSQSVIFHKPMIPVASTCLGSVVHRDGYFGPGYLAAQTLGAVKYCAALKALQDFIGGAAEPLWVEVGTHPLCQTMISSTLSIGPSRLTFTLKHDQDPSFTLGTMAAKAFDFGISVNWTAYHRDEFHSLTVVESPRYAFDLKDYWIPYRNSWRLTKGAKTGERPSPSRKIDPLFAPFHWIDQDLVNADEASIRMTCDVRDDSISSLIEGHVIEGVGLCPGSLYADLAFKASHYLLKRLTKGKPESSEILDITSMIISSPLPLDGEEYRYTLSAALKWSSTTPQVVHIIFESERNGNKSVHCTCDVVFGDANEWRYQWQDSEYLINARYKSIRSASGQTQSLHRDFLYRMFSDAIVHYSEAYRKIEQVDVDYKENEAFATLSVDSMSTQEISIGTHALDALLHLAGFILNTNPYYPKTTVFIASGWDGLRLAESLESGMKYTLHTRFSSDVHRPDVFRGNVSIFSGDRMIGLCRGLRFHRLARRSLRMLLSAPLGKLASPVATHAIPNQHLPSCRDPRDKVKARRDIVDAVQNPWWTGLIKAIAEEVNISPEDLHDSIQVAEIGLDSLLALSLLRRLKDQSGIDLPVDTFTVCETIGDVKTYLSDRSEFKADIEVQIHAPRRDKYTSKPLLEEVAPLRSSTASESSRSNFEVLFSIIATELGTTLDQVQVAESITELGIDSLLMVAIANTYQSQTGSSLDARFFYDNTTIADIRAAFNDCSDVLSNLSQDPIVIKEDDFVSSSSESSPASTGAMILTPPSPQNVPCESMLLQGIVSPSRPALFLLPDGSGSLFSYIHWPRTSTGHAIFALDSPFHKNPKSFNISFAEVAAIYVREIRRLQSHGPYLVGGWSLGGVHAFEVSRQLIEAGERVEKLILFDSPCPGTLPPLPHASLDLLEKAGIFDALRKTTGKVADHTREHFVKITNAFQHWPHRPLTVDEAKHLGDVIIVWAMHGVLEDLPDDDTVGHDWDTQSREMLKARKWLTAKREDFSDGGWKRMVNKDVRICTLTGNHFSIMFPPKVSPHDPLPCYE